MREGKQMEMAFAVAPHAARGAEEIIVNRGQYPVETTVARTSTQNPKGETSHDGSGTTAGGRRIKQGG